MSVDSASTVVRGLAMGPRRISGIQRTDTDGIYVQQRMCGASQSPIDIASDLGGIVHEDFEFTLKPLRGYHKRDEFHEVELLLFREATRVADRVKELAMSRRTSWTAMQEPLTSDRARPIRLELRRSSACRDFYSGSAP